MSYSYSSGSGYYYHGTDLFAGAMIIVYGTLICLFLIAILTMVCCICCRVKQHQKMILVQPLDKLRNDAPVAYVANHDEVQQSAMRQAQLPELCTASRDNFPA